MARYWTRLHQRLPEVAAKGAVNRATATAERAGSEDASVREAPARRGACGGGRCPLVINCDENASTAITKVAPDGVDLD